MMSSHRPVIISTHRCMSEQCNDCVTVEIVMGTHYEAHKNNIKP